jgi:glycosyltransferase involved in cell wall biosynthesis
MKISLIISVYKNVGFLKLVLDALAYQTYTDFEIIISEDGCDEAMRDFVASYKSLQPIRHVTQADEGWRKNRALNRAVQNSRGDYLIFIDGDCVLHHRFIEEHKRLASPHGVVAGKRIKLGPAYTQLYLDSRKDFLVLENKIATELVKLKRDGAQFIEEGVYINPQGLLGFIPRIRSMTHLKGCNMSFYKTALEAINGFDEDYVLPAVGEDADLAWRFRGMGYEMISARNLAVQYHLHHPESWADQSVNLRMMHEKQSRKEYVCRNGLRKLGVQVSDLTAE